MTSISTLSPAPRPEPHSEVATELAHHQFDLRVHAMILLFNAALALYCIFSICEPDTPDTSGDRMPGAADGSASLWAIAIFAVIALLCVIGGSRCWLRAAHASRPATGRLRPIWRRARFAAGVRHRTRFARP